MMTRVGGGYAVVSTTKDGDTTTRNGRYEVARLDDPTDFAAKLVGAVCIAHEFGVDGISFTPAEARAAAEALIRAADICDALIAQKGSTSS
jgi:hypothetical protein